jgi:ABC-type sulfate/molybdate transport systems ATPase subunit
MKVKETDTVAAIFVGHPLAETALKADRFLVMAHGTVDKIVRAKATRGAAQPFLSFSQPNLPPTVVRC